LTAPVAVAGKALFPRAESHLYRIEKQTPRAAKAPEESRK